MEDVSYKLEPPSPSYFYHFTVQTTPLFSLVRVCPMLPLADFIFERKLCNTASCLEKIWDGPANSPFWIEIKTYWRISVYPKQVYRIKLTSSVGRGKDYLESTEDY